MTNTNETISSDYLDAIFERTSERPIIKDCSWEFPGFWSVPLPSGKFVASGRDDENSPIQVDVWPSENAFANGEQPNQ